MPGPADLAREPLWGPGVTRNPDTEVNSSMETLVKQVLDTGTTGFVLLATGFITGVGLAWSFLIWYYKEELGKLPSLRGELATKDARIRELQGQLGRGSLVTPPGTTGTGIGAPQPSPSITDLAAQIRTVEAHVRRNGRGYEATRLRILDGTQVVYVVRLGGGQTSNVILQDGSTKNVDDSRMQVLNGAS